ncbi:MULTISPECIES: helix-turn-helix domain-containing protein [unclassified Streptomyces]|uniref:helix-turn-helix domain-containing protein n=1 Tax=unclassified Streptomyces TaxID=2593676 RepID=UPI00081D5C9E|nr:MULTISPECIES: helix-turn-helix domain-containing protein [unclassified Streptomyces]MYR92361.1 helix-turn-helix domain-containing protein [Streptomyces sp. SID4937]SCD32413.1 DNA binding domain-containing protein, excisionase family [Streptomyces sp. ScaeMP-e83]
MSKQPPSGPLSFSEAFGLPVMVDLRTAARALGICRATAYNLIHRGSFPCPVLRVGGQYRIPTSYLMHTLGIDEQPLYSEDLEAGMSSAEDEEGDEKL